MQKRIANQKGFTLIELMVVIVIVTILAGLAVAKFSDSITQANTTKIKNDLRAIDSVVAQYRAANAKDPSTIAALSDYLANANLIPPTSGKYYNNGAAESIVAGASYGLDPATKKAIFINSAGDTPVNNPEDPPVNEPFLPAGMDKVINDNSKLLMANIGAINSDYQLLANLVEWPSMIPKYNIQTWDDLVAAVADSGVHRPLPATDIAGQYYVTDADGPVQVTFDSPDGPVNIRLGIKSGGHYALDPTSKTAYIVSGDGSIVNMPSSQELVDGILVAYYPPEPPPPPIP